ncbi:MAG: type 1 glutamine amidotransferase domain-containing protein [bacterium]|nr:type 1 glutamine amidotransferase domain-containing protein [bacterium]
MHFDHRNIFQLQLTRRLARSLAVACFAAAFAGSCGGETSAQGRQSRRVLVLLSSSDRLELRDGESYQTGFFLNELTVPVDRLIKAGYEPVLATPDGRPAVMDGVSDHARYFRDAREYERLKNLMRKLLPATRSFDGILAAGLDDYAGVFVPGGHAPMQDLAVDARVGKILRAFHANARPTALICHGPAALLSAAADPGAFVQALAAGDREGARRAAGDWPYAGYRMTAFSESEEDVVENSGRLAAALRWDLEAALRILGARVEVNQANFKSRVVRDRELITGQNPASDEHFTEVLLEALAAAKKN